MLEYLQVKAAIRANRRCGKRCESLQIQIKSNFLTPYTGVQLSDLMQMENDAGRGVLLLWHWFPHPLDMGHGKLQIQPVQSQASVELCLGLGRATVSLAVPLDSGCRGAPSGRDSERCECFYVMGSSSSAGCLCWDK